MFATRPRPLRFVRSAPFGGVMAPRQERLYRFRVNTYRFTEAHDSAGKWLGKSWLGLETNVPCYFEATPSNTAIQAMFMLSEEDMIFTLDILHFPGSVDLETGDVVKQLPATTGTVAYADNIYWMLRGNPRPKVLRANKYSIIGARLELPPVGLS